MKNSGNAIPPVSHCLVINKMDGRLVTKLHQKPLHMGELRNQIAKNKNTEHLSVLKINVDSGVFFGKS